MSDEEGADDEPTIPGTEEGLDLEAAAAVIEKHGFLSWLGVSLEQLEPGRAVMELPYDEKFTNWVTGTIHGGVTAAVVDTTSAFALRSCFDDPMNVTLATTDLNVKYVRPATSDVRVDAAVIRAGDSVGVTRVDVEGTTADGERKSVAIGATTYRLFTGEGS